METIISMVDALERHDQRALAGNAQNANERATDNTGLEEAGGEKSAIDELVEGEMSRQSSADHWECLSARTWTSCTSEEGEESAAATPLLENAKTLQFDMAALLRIRREK